MNSNACLPQSEICDAVGGPGQNPRPTKTCNTTKFVLKSLLNGWARISSLCPSVSIRGKNSSRKCTTLHYCVTKRPPPGNFQFAVASVFCFRCRLSITGSSAFFHTA